MLRGKVNSQFTNLRYGDTETVRESSNSALFILDGCKMDSFTESFTAAMASDLTLKSVCSCHTKHPDNTLLCVSVCV